MAFEGFKLIMNKGLSRFFQTSHTLTLTPDGSKAQYQFGGMYVGSKKIGENEVGVSGDHCGCVRCSLWVCQMIIVGVAGDLCGSVHCLLCMWLYTVW